MALPIESAGPAGNASLWITGIRGKAGKKGEGIPLVLQMRKEVSRDGQVGFKDLPLTSVDLGISKMPQALSDLPN